MAPSPSSGNNGQDLGTRLLYPYFYSEIQKKSWSTVVVVKEVSVGSFYYWEYTTPVGTKFLYPNLYTNPYSYVS